MEKVSKFPQGNNTKAPLYLSPFVSFPQKTVGQAFLSRAALKEASHHCLLLVILDPSNRGV